MTLPANIRTMCNRLAYEQTKAQTWNLGRSLREEYSRRIQAGEQVEALEQELMSRTCCPFQGGLAHERRDVLTRGAA